MMRGAAVLHRLARDETGALLIETALVAPVLVLMSLGAFQVSTMVARQTELQTAAAEGAAIALASPPDTSAKRTTLQQVIMSSAGLGTGRVSVTPVYRCGTDTTFHTSNTGCGSSVMSSYVKIAITDTYTPIWTRFGVGSALQYRVDRYVLLGQES